MDRRYNQSNPIQSNPIRSDLQALWVCCRRSCCRRSYGWARPVEWMLLLAPNQLLLLVALVGSNQSIWRQMLWNPIGNPQSCLEEHVLPIRPVLRVLSPLLSVLIEPPIPISLGGLVFWSSTVDLVELQALEDRSGSYGRIGCRFLYFKGHLPVYSRPIWIANYLDLVILLYI